MEHRYDVLVLGAGAAGLMAAWELSAAGRSVALIEARGRTGGRVHTLQEPGIGVPIELGAEFIHGDLPLTQHWSARAGLSSYEVEGSIWQYKKGKLQEQEDFIEEEAALKPVWESLTDDISVGTLIDRYLQGPGYEALRFTLQRYVEGYYAGNLEQASAFALRRELEGQEEAQCRLASGYGALLRAIDTECAHQGVLFCLNTPVHSVEWGEGYVRLQATDGRHFLGTTLLCTVPLGNWLAGDIGWTPSLPDKQEAARHLGFGPVVKLILRFRTRFWSDETNRKDLNFLFSDTTIPAWWTAAPKTDALLTAWLGGPAAAALQHLTQEQLVGRALSDLAQMFGKTKDWLRLQLQTVHYHNWAKDPYCRGGYSFEVVDGPHWQKLLSAPVARTLYFAGEGLHAGPQIGTVEAALQTGQAAARQLIADHAVG
ncbi:NAD(P)/FAD-dependent oxidoreductase [Flaviaesturariibacter amylovorans]|uniref:Tryptophan 2-monooxygenase n=1 Tax=Flaviaesturariibacter amylovorans TaxID=1084520 RepID=A0ABP8H250_9BACT